MSRLIERGVRGYRAEKTAEEPVAAERSTVHNDINACIDIASLVSEKCAGIVWNLEEARGMGHDHAEGLNTTEEMGGLDLLRWQLRTIHDMVTEAQNLLGKPEED